MFTNLLHVWIIDFLFAISFTRENDNTTVWWIYRTSTSSVQKMGDLYKDSVYCNTQEYVYYFAYFLFHSGFRSVPFSVLRCSNTPIIFTSSSSWEPLTIKYSWVKSSIYLNEGPCPFARRDAIKGLHSICFGLKSLKEPQIYSVKHILLSW